MTSLDISKSKKLPILNAELLYCSQFCLKFFIFFFESIFVIFVKEKSQSFYNEILGFISWQ